MSLRDDCKTYVRWLTVSTLLLAIGTILHLVSPSIAGITPGWMIATYVAAILLLKPSYRKCAGICLVAALLEVFTSKSAFPYGDFPAELAGGYVAAFIVHVLPELKIKKFDLKPYFFTVLVKNEEYICEAGLFPTKTIDKLGNILFFFNESIRLNKFSFNSFATFLPSSIIFTS